MLESNLNNLQRDYWLNRLSGGQSLLNLPNIKVPVKNKPLSAKIIHFSLSKKHTEVLESFITNHGGNSFICLLASWKVLLYRYTSQKDIVLGAHVSNSVLDNEIELWKNTLLLRTEIDPLEYFSNLYKRITESTLKDFKHGNYPFTHLKNDFNMAFSISPNKLFNILLSPKNLSDKIDEDKLFSDVDLKMTFEEIDNQLAFEITYNTNIYSLEMIEKMISHYKQLLSELMNKPNVSIGEIDYLKDEERNFLLKTLNSEKVTYPKDKNLVDLFNEQVRKNPNNISVVFENKKITYQELDQLSNQFSNYLLSNHGVNANDLVAVILDRSEWIVICLLGVLKSGAAYVPIDPNYPEQRKNYIQNDSQCKVTINSSLLNDFINTIETYSLETPKTVKLSPDSLCYIIYTSGTTGDPKGVMIEHRNVVRLFFNSTPLFDFNKNDVWCMFHSFCFDFSVWEMYGALLFGGKLIIVPELVAKDSFEFISLVKKEGITVLNQTPSAFINLMESTNQSEASLSLRYIIFGGEALFPKHLEKWYLQYPDVKFINMYGITETTVHVTYKEIDKYDIDNNISNIGKSIPTLTIYILNEFEKLQPIGVVGELYISGKGLARGYLNRPELTEQKFVANPFVAGERMYSSGDLARLLPDGNIEYIGRKDDQVKISGHRIELGEIESKLNLLPDIKRAIVLASNHLESETQLVAYLQPEKNEVDANDIRQQLEEILPYFMIPSIFMWVEDFPITPNGKIDKKNLPLPEYKRPDSAPLFKKPRTKLEKDITSIWSEQLKIGILGINDNFFEIGGTSLLAQKVATLMRSILKLKIPVTKIYQYPTVLEIAKYLKDHEQPHSSLENIKPKVNNNSSNVAVIGMSGRFPGAESINELWEVLKNSKETISFFTADQLDNSIPDYLRNDPLYVKARGIVPSAREFDAHFFGINPKLAKAMDPQQRLFLEIAWEVLEQSGHLPSQYKGSIGVYAGTGRNTYFENNILPNKELLNQVGVLQVDTVNEKDYISSRTAYHLNLKGPAVSVHSACSTSLLAIAEAVEAIRNNQCDIALAGGSSVTAPIYSGHLYQEGSMLSPDGHCRSFDANGKGTVFSDGAGVILLKSLENAKKDGDFIYGVIKGIGINNDGGGKGSFTAPSVEGQANAISRALRDAQISPSDISYVETHGTATPLGDPIEMEGLHKAFGEQDKKSYCAIGSIKSNMGHLTAAAGVAGFIKTMLALKYQKLPASLGYEKANPTIDFENSPFFVNDTFKDWNCEGKRRAGISSFGVGGTNVHIVVEELEAEQTTSGESRPLELLTWSAKTENSLEGYQTALGNYIKSSPEINLADVAYSLSTTRDTFNKRSFVLSSNSETASNQLLVETTSVKTFDLKTLPDNVAFLFPGQGAQYLQMGKALYEHEDVFREAVDECTEILLEAFDFDIRTIIYPEHNSIEAENNLKDTQFTQPALFVIEYALSQLWMSWGIKPTLLCGHSIGEFVAAHLAGIFTLKDALILVAIRGKLVSELPGGSMLSVRTTYDYLSEILPKTLSIAAVNSDVLCVVSGEDKPVKAFANVLEEKEIPNRLLKTSHAFHSSMMNPVLEKFEAEVKKTTLNVPRVPIISTVTGKWLTDTEATNPQYWTNHLRATVNFSEAMETALELEDIVLLEVGPGRALTTLSQQKKKSKSASSIASLVVPDANETSYHTVLSALGQLWLKGIDPNWQAFYKGQSRQKVLLPAYVFERKLCWVDPPIEEIAILNLSKSTETLNNQSIQSHTQMNTVILPNRKITILEKISEIIMNTSGMELESSEHNHSFLELGLDSLVLTQMAITCKNEFDTPITFRQLNGEFSTPNLLASYLDENLPTDRFAPAQAQVAPPTPNAVYSNAPIQHNGANVSGPPVQASNYASYGDNGSAMSLIAQQLQLLGKQLELLQGNNTVPTPVQPQPVQQPLLAQNVLKPEPVSNPSSETLSEDEIKEHKKPFGASPKIEKHATEINTKQQAFLEELTVSYNKKTASSKAYAQKHRPHMSDPRVVSGFKPLTKELVYPLVVEKSSGNKLWDLDGNEYIDALNGFGSCLLGHQPDFIKEALHQQIESGYEVGPQHPLAGEVCELLCELTKHERAALCNTGSEAVLGAMRIARTVTGRSLIVAFTTSYHGIMDEVIVRGSRIKKTFPAAAGIMPESVQNMLILDYGTEESLQIIRDRAHELAAVLVEPVQSRRPEFQPVEFLKEVRNITKASNTTLIFDEIITGFRMHPQGLQGMFGIKADVATYGKVIGGGVSIGAILGDKKYMDALDGGYWQFGDDSAPEVGVTYFAGTFVRHPLALAATKASLLHLKENGPKLQNDLATKTERLAIELNTIFKKRNLPIQINYFRSLWRLSFLEEIPYAELIFVLMRKKGIHIWDGFPCFMTTAYTEDDVTRIINCFVESVDELTAVGVFQSNISGNFSPIGSKTDMQSLNTPPVVGAKLGIDKSGNPAWFVADENNNGSFVKIEL